MANTKQTSIDKPSCPKGHGNLASIKSWTLKGMGEGKKHKATGTKVTAWRCQECGFSLRTYDKLEE